MPRSKRHLHERLVKVHGLHNLIRVWNGQDEAWYPGGDTVDMVGWDVYDDSSRSPRSTPAAKKKVVYHHPNVISLDKLPAFLKAPQ